MPLCDRKSEIFLWEMSTQNNSRLKCLSSQRLTANPRPVVAPPRCVTCVPAPTAHGDGPLCVPKMLWVAQQGCIDSTVHPWVALQDRSSRIAANVPHPIAPWPHGFFSPKPMGPARGLGVHSHPTNPEAVGMWGGSISVLTHRSPREEQWGHRLQRFHGSAPS